MQVKQSELERYNGDYKPATGQITTRCPRCNSLNVWWDEENGIGDCHNCGEEIEIV